MEKLEVIKKTRLFNFPARGPNAETIMISLLLSPPAARSLAEAGYSKADVERCIHEHATMRLEDFDWVMVMEGGHTQPTSKPIRVA